MRFHLAPVLLAVVLGPALSWQVTTLVITAYTLVLGVLWVLGYGRRAARVGDAWFIPDLLNFAEAARRTVTEGPIQSGFLGLLAFPALAVLIVFAVTGIRL